jgi:Peptidase family M41/ATPase family associated with various cellular activities (AAA)
VELPRVDGIAMATEQVNENAETSAAFEPIDRAQIALKNNQLEAAGATLKQKFIGIDDVIDELMDAMRVWWLMPQVLTRPVIINLWGMTGVGKTDLVRRLVRELDFQERFVECELSNVDTTSYRSSVSQVLASNHITDGEPAIVLFDEIQRFNTLDTDGKPLQTTKFTDFWELLSDGRLAKRERDDLKYMMEQMRFELRDQQRRKDLGEDIKVDDHVGWWSANNYKTTLGLEESADEVAEMTQSQIIKRIQLAMTKKVVYEPVDHSKTLCIISGNLDDAFSMAGLTSEADVDADIFHAFTEKVSVVDVKGALTRKFKPEQVARFGNIHLIYKSLRKADFDELIHRELTRIIASTQARFNIAVTFSESVAKLVYRNGVFPVQGVRPVFSSVADIVESNLARFLFEALMIDGTSIDVDYDVPRSMLVAQIATPKKKKPSTIERPYVGRLDRVRERNVDDVVANVSVHESGHAVAYAVLVGLAPLQLTAKVASSYAAGFTFPHDVHETRAQMLAKIKVLLAGGIAEEVVFGEANATTGRSADREQATMLALDFVRKHGFDREFQAHYGLEYSYVMDKTVTDLDVEKMMARLVAETHELLKENIKFLLALSSELRSAGKLEAPAVAAIATRFGVPVVVKPEGYLHLPRYAAELATATEKSER